MSSLVMCRGFRDAKAAEKEDAAASLTPSYIPFISKGAQFEPTSSSRSYFGQRLFAYFDVEDAQVLTGSTKVQMQLKVVRARHGEVEIDTGPRDLSKWFAPGSSVAHVAEEIKVDKLRPGWYRVDLQAFDSNGRTSAVRSVNFDVE